VTSARAPASHGAASARGARPSPRSAWGERLARDAMTARLHQTPELAAVTTDVLARAKAAGALSFALTGSTALARRSPVSDLDFYVVGSRPARPESAEELDVYAIDAPAFRQALLEGDDYLHWTLRFGLILYDSGPLRWAYEKTQRDDLWPDPQLKVSQALRALDLAEAITLSGDHAAAVEQARIAYSLAARWWLLAHRVFPRARRDLPEQLAGTPLAWLGEALRATIFDDRRDDALLDDVARLRSILLDAAAGRGAEGGSVRRPR
jgi:hypothetical protein